MNLGRRPSGITIGARKVSDWKDKEIVAYISARGFVEYDDVEKQILNDPWVDGWETRERGGTMMDLPLDSPYSRVSDRSERYQLKIKGWGDCDKWMKKQKQKG